MSNDTPAGPEEPQNPTPDAAEPPVAPAPEPAAAPQPPAQAVHGRDVLSAQQPSQADGLRALHYGLASG